MEHVKLIYGNEPQLIEEHKAAFLRKYGNLEITVLDNESGPTKISEQLSEDSLFGDAKVFILVNIPIFQKSGQKEQLAWSGLYELLLNYSGANPVLLIYHDVIDKRIKLNNNFLKDIDYVECKRLEGGELLHWISQYCKDNGYSISRDGMDYISHLIELWKDVPVTFIRTELDRYFLQLEKGQSITSSFLQENSSDYGAKNIFTFKEALLNQNVPVLLELFPFMFSYKEIDRAMSYIEGQLRLQLIVSECRSAGMTVKQVQDLFKEHESTIKAYPIELAYKASSRISIPVLSQLLRDLYEVIRDSRTSRGTIWRFRDLCLTYCGYKG